MTDDDDDDDEHKYRSHLILDVQKQDPLTNDFSGTLCTCTHTLDYSATGRI